MKKTTLSLAFMAGLITLSSCTTSNGSISQGVGSAILNSAINGATSNATNTATTAVNGLSNILGSILGSSATLSQKNIEGTWNYTGSDCVFESENLLAKAGGAVAANKVENELNTQLSKFGIKKGACTFTFNGDNTYSAKLGSRTIQGQYTLDTKNKKIKMTYLGGLATMTPRIAMTNGKLSLLLESDKMLKLMKGVSALSKNSSISAVSSILSNYNGMYIGMKLSK